MCAIHQPTFFPWLGFFDKLKRCDVFVFLDRAHYQKSGSSMNSWCNRVKINVRGRGAWISCPVIREHGPQAIHTVRIDRARPWRDQVHEVVESNYGKAANFAAVFPFLEEVLTFDGDLLADFNINAICRIAGLLGIETPWVRERDLPPTDAWGTERLVKLSRMVGADAYMCGAGAKNYMDERAFPAAGLRLVHQDFTPLPYGPADRFIPGLSVIDYLMYRDH